MLAATQAFALAGGGSFGLFSSLAATDCALMNDGVTNTSYYVIQTHTTGSTGGGYSAVIPPCAGFVHNMDVKGPTVSVYLGNSQMGASMGYGGCRTGLIVVAQIVVTRTGPAVGCCAWTVGPNPLLVDPDGNPWTTPYSMDCSSPSQNETAAGGTGIISAGGAGQCACSVPNKENTWGAVKELFRQGI